MYGNRVAACCVQAVERKKDGEPAKLHPGLKTYFTQTKGVRMRISLATVVERRYGLDVPLPLRGEALHPNMRSVQQFFPLEHLVHLVQTRQKRGTAVRVTSSRLPFSSHASN